MLFLVFFEDTEPVIQVLLPVSNFAILQKFRKTDTSVLEEIQVGASNPHWQLLLDNLVGTGKYILNEKENKGLAILLHGKFLPGRKSGATFLPLFCHK